MTHIDQIRTEVRSAKMDQEELNSGYIFRFHDSSVYSSLSKFINHEKQCCAFLDFDLDRDDSGVTCRVTLNNSILNTDNVKKVIRAMFTYED